MIDRGIFFEFPVFSSIVIERPFGSNIRPSRFYLIGSKLRQEANMKLLEYPKDRKAVERLFRRASADNRETEKAVRAIIERVRHED